MTKDRFYDILLTALVGAGIAFLQSILAQMGGNDALNPNELVAGVSAGTLKLIVNRIYFT